jgi:hypothetical protein
MDPELALILDTVARIVEGLSLPLAAAILAIGGVAVARTWRRRAGSGELEALHDEIQRLRGSVDAVGDEVAQLQGRVDFTERLLTASDDTPLPGAERTP